MDWAATQYVRAIGSYVESTPGLGKTYPARVDELLEDRRYATPRRHLRELYSNPVSQDGQWGLVVGTDLRIHGVRTTLPGDSAHAAREWTYVRSAGA